MNIFFMGTPEFAVPTLDILNKKYNVIGVFTQPPVSYTHLRAHET